MPEHMKTPPAVYEPPATMRDAAPRLTAAEFREAGHELVDAIAEFLEALPSRKVTAGDTAEEIRGLIDADASIPEEGSDAGALLRSTARLLFDHSLFNGHPRFLGYITSSPAHIGILGDLLAAAVNQNVAWWRVGPVATQIEAQTVRWIAEMVGYPAGGSGIMLSGGNMANTVALFAARAAAAGQESRRSGLARAGALRVYASEEAHTWIKKAADLAGLGTEAVRWIPTDEALRMDVDALRAAMAHDRHVGERPMMVVGTAGSVSTGAVDPLPAIAEVCREEDVWFHVDGAYGAFAAQVPGAPADLAALALADSVAVDPHKWLYAPLEAGCVLVRDEALLRDAFSYSVAYYNFGGEPLNYVDLGPQNSRGFRALKVWLGLRQVGRRGYLRSIADDIALGRRLHERAAAHPELEAVTLGLSIATFRVVPADLRERAGMPDVASYLDTLNQQVLERMQREGEAFVSNAVVRGRYLLRGCVVNFNTTAADIDRVVEIAARVGREVDGAERPSDLR
jgi:aromatic-L-amino-acid/L-tryptophan decarboxylase